MKRTIVFLLVIASASPVLAGDDRLLEGCLRYESAEERLQCLDAIASMMKPEDSGRGAALLACTEESFPLKRLDCFTVAIGRESPREEPAREGRLGVDFALPKNYRPEDADPDCLEAEVQERHAAARETDGGIAAGVGGAMSIAGAVLGAIAIGISVDQPEPDTNGLIGLGIGAIALTSGGGVSLGAAGIQFQMAWVHRQLAGMESRRCGGGVISIERR